MLASNLSKDTPFKLSLDPLEQACRRDATITEAGAARAKVP
jgi:hypothetical protein